MKAIWTTTIAHTWTVLSHICSKWTRYRILSLCHHRHCATQPQHIRSPHPTYHREWWATTNQSLCYHSNHMTLQIFKTCHQEMSAALATLADSNDWLCKNTDSTPKPTLQHIFDKQKNVFKGFGRHKHQKVNPVWVGAGVILQSTHCFFSLNNFETVKPVICILQYLVTFY